MKKSLQSCLFLASLLWAAGAQATVYYWDPEGTGTESASSVTATWDTVTAQWASASAQQSPVVWASGDAADFCAGSASVGTFTVTLNSTVTIGGIFNGSLSTPGCNVTVSGTGDLYLASGADAFANSSAGTTTLAVPMSGPGQVAFEGAGKFYFNGNNTFTGGVSIGYVGLTAFTGTAEFNSSSSFGTGAMTMTTAGAGCTLTEQGSTLITLANSWVAANVNMNINANTAGLILSGPWNLSTTPMIGAGGTGSLVLSGTLSGAGGFTKYGTGPMTLGGANTYTGLTTISNGILTILADTGLGAAPGTATVDISLNGGTLNASNTFTLNSKRLIVLGANSSLAVSSGKTLTYGGGITGPFNLTKSGAGTLLLSGLNAYTGNTSISAGTVEADSTGGSSLGTNTVNVLSGATLSGVGLVSGPVTGAGSISPGTAAGGPGNLTLGNGLNMSGGSTFVWTLSSNSTTSNFSSLTLNGGNLVLGGTSKLSINITNNASTPNTNDPFWLTQEEWTVVNIAGSSANPSGAKFSSILNGTYATGNFSSITNGNGGIAVVYLPNFPVFDTLYDSGQGFFGGENLILTNFSGLNLFVWSSTDATLSVSNWTMVGQMDEQNLAPGLPGYSRYSINVNPAVSPTFYVAGNTNGGQYVLPAAPTAIVTTPDFANFTVYNTNVSVSTSGVLGLLPAQPAILPGSAYSNGQLQLQFNAPLNQAYTVQGSVDLLNWTNVGSGTVSSVPMTFTDTAASNYNAQYYRVILPVTFP